MTDPLRRVRILGLLQGVELDTDQLELLAHDPRQEPPPEASTFDPLSDPLDEPFPDEGI